MYDGVFCLRHASAGEFESSHEQARDTTTLSLTIVSRKDKKKILLMTLKEKNECHSV